MSFQGAKSIALCLWHWGFLFTILNVCLTLNGRVDSSPLSLYRQKINYDRASNLSLVANQPIASNASKSAYGDRNISSPLKTNYKTPYLGRNAPSLLQDNSLLDANGTSSTSLNQPLSFPLSACPPLNVSNTPRTSLLSSIQQKVSKSPSTNGSLNAGSKLSSNHSLVSRALSEDEDEYVEEDLDFDGFLAEIMANQPDTAKLPIPPLGHNEAWNAAWIRGKLAWNAFSIGQRARNEDFPDIGSWAKFCCGSFVEPIAQIKNGGLLQKIDQADRPVKKLVGLTYSSWKSEHSPAQSAYWNGLSARASAIINYWWDGYRITGTEPLQLEWAPQSWADITVQEWLSMCASFHVSPTSLRYVVLFPVTSSETESVAKDIAEHERVWDTSSPEGGADLFTWTPNDENFYALLGTGQGIGAIELLYKYPETFARAPQMRKTIENVRFSATTTDSGNHLWSPQSVPIWARQASRGNSPYAFAFTLQDTWPPGNTGPPPPTPVDQDSEGGAGTAEERGGGAS